MKNQVVFEKEAEKIKKKERELKTAINKLQSELEELNSNKEWLLAIAKPFGISAADSRSLFSESARRGRATKAEAEAVRSAVLAELKRSADSPLSTKSIKSRIEDRGIEITGAGTTSNLAALLMSDPEGRFENVERGYWQLADAGTVKS